MSKLTQASSDIDELVQSVVEEMGLHHYGLEFQTLNTTKYQNKYNTYYTSKIKVGETHNEQNPNP